MMTGGDEPSFSSPQAQSQIIRRTKRRGLLFGCCGSGTTRSSRKVMILSLTIVLIIKCLLKFLITLWKPYYYAMDTVSSTTTAKSSAPTTTPMTTNNTTLSKNDDNHHDDHHQQQPKPIRKRSIQPRRIIYSNIRHDRSGGAIQDMLMCHAYVYNKYHGKDPTIIYGGACGYSDNINDYKYMISGIGLSQILTFACPTTDNRTSQYPGFVETEILDRHVYTEPADIRIFTPEWIHFIQKHYIVPHITKEEKKEIIMSTTTNSTTANANTTTTTTQPSPYVIAVHVRRGDVNPCCYENRYLPNSHYISLIQRYVTKFITSSSATSDNTSASKKREIHVKIFSESKSFESLDEFRNVSSYYYHSSEEEESGQDKDSSTINIRPKIHVDLLLDGDPLDAWKALLVADVVIMSKSSFSIVPAVLNLKQQVSATATTTTSSRQQSKSQHTSTTTHIVYTLPYNHRPLQHWDVVKKQTHKSHRRNCTNIQCKQKT